jgi:hypothetical protein
MMLCGRRDVTKEGFLTGGRTQVNRTHHAGAKEGAAGKSRAGGARMPVIKQGRR